MSTTAIVYENKVGDFAEDRWFGDKPSTGICFSGGGSRAQVLAMGQLRGLEKLGLMDNVKYISSVSGGTWASVQYTYREKTDTKDLFGEYIPPQKLSKKILNTQTPKMALTSVRKKIPLGNISLPISPFTFNFLLNLCKTRNEEIDNSRQWESVVADTFLKPLGLLKDFKTDLFDLNEESFNEFKEKNPDLKTKKVFLANEKSPYLVANGVITKPHNQRYVNIFKSSSNFMGVEFTPLYTEVAYAKGKVPTNSWFSRSIYIGNGAVNSICFGSKPTDKIDLENKTISVHQDDEAFGLSAVAGISSYFIGGIVSNTDFVKVIYEIVKGFLEKYISSSEKDQQLLRSNQHNYGFLDIVEFLQCLSNIKERYSNADEESNWEKLFDDLDATFGKLVNNPVLRAWSPLAVTDAKPKSELFDFSDGGCMDNLGVIPLLRRNVKKLVVFINGETPLSTDIKEFTNVSTKDIDFWLTALFGVTKDDFKSYVRLGVDISHNQVFNGEDFEMVYKGLKSAKIKKQAVITTTKHKVIENEWWGIDGNHEVEICWVYNEDAQSWHDALPSELRDEFKAGALKIESNIEDKTLNENLFGNEFPRYSTFLCTGLGFTDIQANALAQFASWVVAGDENKWQFNDILK